MPQKVFLVTSFNILSSASFIYIKKTLLQSYAFHWPFLLSTLFSSLTFIVSTISIKSTNTKQNLSKKLVFLFGFLGSLKISAEMISLDSNSFLFHVILSVLSKPIVTVFNLILGKRENAISLIISSLVCIIGFTVFYLNNNEHSFQNIRSAAYFISSSFVYDLFEEKVRSSFLISESSFTNQCSYVQSLFCFILSIYYEILGENSVYNSYISTDQTQYALIAAVMSCSKDVSLFLLEPLVQPVFMNYISHITIFLIFVVGYFTQSNSLTMDREMKTVTGVFITIVGLVTQSLFLYSKESKSIIEPIIDNHIGADLEEEEVVRID